MYTHMHICLYTSIDQSEHSRTSGSRLRTEQARAIRSRVERATYCFIMRCPSSSYMYIIVCICICMCVYIYIYTHNMYMI